eukprot:g8098.t1
MKGSTRTPNPLRIDKHDSEKDVRTPGTNISFTKHVGLDGALVLLLLFSISGVLLYIVFLYTASFRVFSRGAVYVFFVLAALYFGLGVYFALRWRMLATRYRLGFSEDHHKPRKLQRINSALKQTVHRCHRIRLSFQINSPFFLWKLYSFETIGYVVQVFNFTTIYLCTLPPWFNISLAALFMLEAIFSAITIRRKLTTRLRDSIVKIDTVLDTIDAVAPLIFIELLRIRIPVTEMLQIILWPAISLLSKLRSIFRQVLQRRAADRSVRNSKTLLRYRNMAMTQQEAVPAPVRTGIFVATVVYAILMASVGVWIGFAGSVAAKECRAQGAEYIWNNCLAKVPTCNDLFVPDCNCAIISIENHNMTRLPTVVNSMTALRRVEIRNGPLKALDDEFGVRAKQFSSVNMDFNRLTSLPKSFESIVSLHTVYMAFNEIDTVPEGFWKLSELYSVDLSTNKLGRTFSNAKLNLPNLHFVNLGNNSIGSFPDTWDSPHLLTLAFSGNNT